MRKTKIKIIILFALIGFFLFLENTPDASAAYRYEGVAFYAKDEPGEYAAEGTAFYAHTSQTDGTVPIYRFFNSSIGDHFYSTSNADHEGYVLESTAFYAYTTHVEGTIPVYRFYSSITTKDHLYTTSESEKSSILNNPQWGYTYEGVVFYVFGKKTDETSPVYRFFSAATGDHFYTASVSEKNSLTLSPVYRFYNRATGDHFFTTSDSPHSGYVPEGITFYAYSTQVSGSTPVYRYYSSAKNDHFYSTAKQTYDGYKFEGTAFYAFKSQVSDTFPVYRFYDTSTGNHFYTISESTKNRLMTGDLGPEISVGLWNYTKSAINDSPFKIDANKKYNIREKNGNIIARIEGSTQTRVSYDADGYLKVSGSISSKKVKTAVYFDAADGDNSNLVMNVHRPGSDYDEYRGKVKVQYTDSSNIWVINILPLEQYVWGDGEMAGTGDFEHTKVMATIFRTYGYWYIKYATKYSKYGFKIRSDSGSQIYRGHEWEDGHPNIPKAADSTKARVATYDGDVALTPYSSWSDGRTRSFKERWGSSEYPWCKSVDDPYGEHPSLSTQALEDAGNHMVGLIAHGSLNLAGDHDWSYSKIMKYYYTGIDLNKAY